MRLLRTRNAFFVCVALCAAFMPLVSYAQSAVGLAVVPAVVDEKAKARDILKHSLVITNTSDRMITVYPQVNDINATEGEQGFHAALNAPEASASLANWIEITRGVIQLAPGEQKSIPFVIKVNLNAIPGTYHAEISFGYGSTREEAEAKPPLASLTVNVEVQADIKELMQLNAFTTDNVVFTGDDVLFKYQLQNIGNQDLQPKGEIRIYDRRGEEVATLDVNGDGKLVGPDQVTQLATVWTAVQGFGKYKALLDVDYGKSQVASVHDTVYFWVVPWRQLLMISIITLVAIILLVLHFHRVIEERHLGRLALAGALKSEVLTHLQNMHMPFSHSAVPGTPTTSPIRLLTPTPEMIVKDAIQEQIQEKKTMLDRFKRTGFVPPAVTTMPPPVPMQVQQQAVQQVSAAPVVPSAPRPAQVSGTIDLKNVWQNKPEPAVTQNHVINLKK